VRLNFVRLSKVRVRHSEDLAPRLALTWGEARVLTDFVRGRRLEKDIVRAHPGDGRPVMVLPGMFSADHRTSMLRRIIGKAGYEAHGWELGRNLPSKTDILDQLDARLDAVMDGRDIPISLVGWSLGGLIAREYAKRAPQRVAAVITMGSPFSGNPRHNRAWRAYEMAARHKVDASPFAAGLSTKPPVPTTAIWSRRDGVIPPRAARGLPHERDTAVEVHCGHLGYICAPDAMIAVLRALAG
jgi:pimeloyl-ACP methyl ester carboxylesterase